MIEHETDAELLTRWCGQDNRAGSALVKRYFHALYRFFSNKARGHEEDLIQQTFFACVKSRDEIRDEANFRAYLFMAARRQLLTHYRKAHRRQALDFTSTSVHDLAPSPSSLVARLQERELLDSALRRLPVDQQIALELTYWEGMTAPEVAQVLGVPENTVYSRLHRGKQHLLQALELLSSLPEHRERALRLLVRVRPTPVCSPR